MNNIMKKIDNSDIAINFTHNLSNVVFSLYERLINETSTNSII